MSSLNIYDVLINFPVTQNLNHSIFTGFSLNEHLRKIVKKTPTG